MTAKLTEFSPKWITEAETLAIHDRQLAEHGGGEGVRDIGLLQSALARPQHALHYSPDISLAQLAASCAYGIAKNHPFIDGSKRTALVVSLTFLLINGYRVNATQQENYLTFLSLAEGTLSEEELAAWITLKLVEKS